MILDPKMEAKTFIRSSCFRVLNRLFSGLRFGACFDVPRTAPKRLLAASEPLLGRFWVVLEALLGIVFACILGFLGKMFACSEYVHTHYFRTLPVLYIFYH